MNVRALVIVAVALGPIGCGGGSGDVDGSPVDADVADAAVPAVPATALFEVPRDAPPPSGFYALPYPNDLRAGEDGRLELSDHPAPNAIIAAYLETIAATQRYFGLSSAIFLRFDAPIDPASLPASPDETFATGASVYLVDVDPESPERGRHTPLRFRFETRAGEVIGENWLAALPYPGFVLAENRRYALVVTNRVRALDGSPVGRGPDFAAIAGREVPGDPHLALAQARYQPLWTWLDEPGGDERDDVVAAAVFTTQDATSLLGRVRDVIWRDLPVPEPRDVVWRENQRAYALYHGRYDSPRFQAGVSPYRRIRDGGNLAVDDQGEPIVQAIEELRFAVTVPTAPLPDAGWPVVLYAHGTGGDFETFLRNGTARQLAERGIACLSIDQLMHGPRLAGGGKPEIAFFNYQNPLAARGNVLQSALDDFQLARLALAFDYSERRPGGRTIRFDSDRIYFFGHSQGSLTGLPFVAREPLVKGAIFSGAGGLLYLAMLHKTQPLDVRAMVQLLIRDVPLDEFNPTLALLQAFFDPADSAAYARLLVREPPPGFAAKNVFLSEGLVDRYTPIPTIEALATAIDVDQVGPEQAAIDGLRLRGREVLSPPIAGNAGDVTAVVAQYDERAGSDGHFVVFEVPAAIAQSIGFLDSLARTGTAEVASH